MGTYFWLVERIEECKVAPNGRQWNYDCNHGFLIEATSAQEARELAAEQAADEGAEAWLKEEYSTCSPLVPKKYPSIILTAFNAA